MVCLLSQRSIRGCPPLEEGQGLGLHGRPLPLSSSPRPLKVKAAPLPPAPKKDGRRDGGREEADTEQSAGSDTHTHTLRTACIHPLLLAVRPFATLPAPAHDHSTLPGQKRGGGHRKEGSAGWWKAGGAVWRGPAPQAGVLPGPAPSGSELRWAWEGASSPFVPYPSAPLPNTHC